jgi:hypothetical protein
MGKHKTVICQYVDGIKLFRFVRQDMQGGKMPVN